MLMETNPKDALLKETIIKEFDAIEVPDGLKEELWSQVDSKRKKKIFSSKLLPYIVAAAVIAIFIPLALSILSTTDMASNELAGKSFNLRVAGDPNFAGDLTTIETFIFSNDNTFINAKNSIEGTYEFTDDKLMLLIEDENEMLEIEYKLAETDRVASGYWGNLVDISYETQDSNQISKYWHYSNELYQHSYVIFSEK